jgi:hypothetical protein
MGSSPWSIDLNGALCDEHPAEILGFELKKRAMIAARGSPT